ncbi:major facilitator superfamily protein [Actinidia rufa]|uniref:Major facilitator superfamily protein n=1 Tax=Actinidia rufa TaxID=165716 RepID=A0A7J0GPL8_9ERIC|nr:major facilitator superfamily protein [Actinidia rufa]
MASQGGSSSSVNIPEIREENENKPLWNYVTRLDKTARGGGNWEFQCKFCNGIFKGSYTRVKAHLMKLTGKGISACKKKVPLPPCVSLGAMSHSQGEAKRRRSSDTSGSETMSGGAIMVIKIAIRIVGSCDPDRRILLSVAETRFASTIVMLKRFKLIKGGLQAMVINDKWSCYREDDVGRARFVKDKVLSDVWWDSIDYILKFTGPIYDMIQACDTDTPCLHLVYDMWDSMIEQVKAARYRHEGKMHEEDSTFYGVIHQILVDRWNKNNTPLHCLAHSLNPSDDWLHESANRVPPHKDEEVSRERLKCLKSFGPVAPFDAAACFLAIGMAIILSSWTENYGDASENKDLLTQFRGAAVAIASG